MERMNEWMSEWVHEWKNKTVYILMCLEGVSSIITVMMQNYLASIKFLQKLLTGKLADKNLRIEMIILVRSIFSLGWRSNDLYIIMFNFF